MSEAKLIQRGGRKADPRRLCAVCHYRLSIGIKWSARLLSSSTRIPVKARREQGFKNVIKRTFQAPAQNKRNRLKDKTLKLLASFMHSETKLVRSMESTWAKHPIAVKFENSKRSCLYQAKRRSRDPAYKIRLTMRLRVWKFLGRKNPSTTSRTLNLIGCAVEHLVSHIQSQFANGMTWGNYGVHGWHIDHIKPCAAFDFTNPEDVRKCFHYSNLRPLWAEDNWSKNSIYNGVNHKSRRVYAFKEAVI